MWSDYKLKSITEYWQGLETDIGIPISSLILEIDGFGDEQSTWVHPEIAIDLGAWVSVPGRIWVNRAIAFGTALWAIARFILHQQHFFLNLWLQSKFQPMFLGMTLPSGAMHR
ncbi:KilA-N domain-containing protein [Scytonema sp. PCC 10023]|uniref:KilA-N domain-containing protein n=1 Tax=Scytonema sp. PCC 10023 TaxID=1680591 RepID=UPI0039C6A0C2